ncbi:MAG: hypothetical protein AB1333_01545 [Patescibacteria group bacterium]
MERKSVGLYVTIALVFVFALTGFFFVFDSIGTLRADVRNVEMALELANKERQATPVEQPIKKEVPEIKNTTSSEEQAPETVTSVATVPTAILMDVQSSPTLLPQTNLSLSVESISKNSNNTLSINFKIYTNKATGNSSIDPSKIFSIVALDGNNIESFKTNGQFSSIPPKSMISGSILFRISQAQNTVILQIGYGENIKFYEVNFSEKSYKETVIG